MNYLFTFEIIHIVGNDNHFTSVYSLNLELTDRKQKLSGSLYGAAYGSRCDFKKEIEYSKRGLSIAEETGNSTSQGDVYINIGISYRSLGDSNTAIKLYELGISILAMPMDVSVIPTKKSSFMSWVSR